MVTLHHISEKEGSITYENKYFISKISQIIINHIFGCELHLGLILDHHNTMVALYKQVMKHLK